MISMKNNNAKKMTDVQSTNKSEVGESNNYPRVSIILCNFNGLNYIKETLPKFIQFDYPNYEISLVDDGSTDGSREWIEKFISDHEKSSSKGSSSKKNKVDIVYYKNPENLGIPKSRNRAVLNATGDYYMFFDNDIICTDKNIFNNLLEYYRGKDKIAYLLIPLVDKERLESGETNQYGSYYSFYGIMRNKILNIKDVMAIEGGYRCVVTFSQIFCSKKVWQDIGGFDERQKFNLDDDDISTRANVYGYENWVYNKTYLIHTGLANRKDNRKYYNSFKLYYSGKVRPLLKNMQFGTLVYMIPMFYLSTCLMTLKQAITRKYPLVIFAFISSFLKSIADFPDTLKERKIIQAKRKVSDKSFLSVKFPLYSSTKWYQEISLYFKDTISGKNSTK